MQDSFLVRCIRVLAVLTLAGWLGHAQAVELGEPQVRSHVGQPLVADIELTMLADGPVLVRLANPDVFRGANIAVHPILANLNMTVMRRDGRQFLHITSVKPVDTDYVHLFLNLGQGGKTDVRAATLWLTPDPAPPAPQPAPPPAPAAPTAPAVAPAPPARLRSSAPATPAAAPARQLTAEQLKVCSTLDYKNGLLSAQIVELEEKVRLLQLAMASRAEHDAPLAVAAPAIKAPMAIKPAAPDKKVAVPPASGFPWLLVALAVLLVAVMAGAVFFLLRRRKKAQAPDAASAGDDAAAPIVAPGDKADYMAKLKESLQRKKKETKGE